MNHIDGDPHNNRSDNLEWVTRSENLKHAFRVGLREKPDHRGMENPRAVLTKNDVLEIRERYTPGEVTHQELADEYGVSKSTVGMVLTEDTWRHLL